MCFYLVVVVFLVIVCCGCCLRRNYHNFLCSSRLISCISFCMTFIHELNIWLCMRAHIRFLLLSSALVISFQLVSQLTSLRYFFKWNGNSISLSITLESDYIPFHNFSRLILLLSISMKMKYQPLITLLSLMNWPIIDRNSRPRWKQNRLLNCRTIATFS